MREIAITEYTVALSNPQINEGTIPEVIAKIKSGIKV